MKILRRSHFESLEDIHSTVTAVLKGHVEDDFQPHVQAWQKYWNVYVKTEGKYCEDEHTN